MRCFKSVNTERRDEYNRVILKSVLIWFSALCILFLVHNFIVPGDFKPTYNLIFILGLVIIYPMHKALHVLGLFRYRAGLKIGFKRHFYILPCLQVRLKQMVPIQRYIFSLLLPFFLILVGFIVLSLFIPIWTSPFFLILLSVHIGMSYPSFIQVNHVRKCPKNCYVEDAKSGFSILIAE